MVQAIAEIRTQYKTKRGAAAVARRKVSSARQQLANGSGRGEQGVLRIGSDAGTGTGGAVAGAGKYKDESSRRKESNAYQSLEVFR
jgi:hypothetical protein